MLNNRYKYYIALKIFLLCIITSFLLTIVYQFLQNIILWQNEIILKGQIMPGLYSLKIIIYFTTISGLIIFPFIYFCILNKSHTKCIIFIILITSIEIAVSIFLWGSTGWRGPFLTLVIASFFCKFSKFKIFETTPNKCFFIKTPVKANLPGSSWRLSYKLLLLFKVIIICIIGALYSAIIFILFLKASLPPSDLAFDTPIFVLLFNPFIWAIAIPIAVISGLGAVPLVYFSIYKKNFDNCIFFIFTVTLAEIMIGTFIYHHYAWFGAYFAFIASSLFCKFSKVNFFQKDEQ